MVNPVRSDKHAGAVFVDMVPDSYMDLYLASRDDLVRWAEAGVSAAHVARLAERMKVPKAGVLRTLGLARSTVARRVREAKPLSFDGGLRVLGLACLIGQVEAVVQEYGDPTGFDAPAWIAGWLDRPQPALGGLRPSE